MKKLYLDTVNKKIAGVCAGLGEYLELDVTVIRIVFLIALICGTFGFWAYLIIWAVAPPKPLPPVNPQ
jgi:phage shock protein PspC (stress-responsive transcriptional regulator)